MVNIVGLVAVNSVDFLHKVFDLYENRNLFALIKKNNTTNTSFDFTSVIEPDENGGWFTQKIPPIHSNDLAQVVFTSGTTGASKAIALSHNNLADTVKRLIEVMELDDTVSEYVGVPVTYSFGLGRVRTIAAVGGRSFIPSNGFNVDELISMIGSGEINSISAVPSQWRIVFASAKKFQSCANKVKWIEIGSQFMSADEKRTLLKIFPNAKIIQHYGLTEASRSTFLKIHDPAANLESVGSPTGSIGVRVNTNGILEVKGENVSPGQFLGGKLASLTDEDGWLLTGDKARIEDGSVFYEGRADDIINCGGVKISPEVFLQQLTNEMNEPAAIDVSKYLDPIRGEGILIAKEKKCGIGDAELEKIALKVCAFYDGNISSSIKIITLEKLPRTSTGKVKRTEITTFYEKEKSAEIGSADNSFNEIFNNIFKLQKVAGEDTFESLHGDSINHVELSIVVEKKLGYEPASWESMTINQLNGLLASGADNKKSKSLLSMSSLDMSMWLRVVAILAVVVTHAGSDLVGRGTLLLSVLVGYNIARFKFNDLVNDNSLKTMIPYVMKILVPYYVLAVVFCVWNRAIEWDVLLLYANLLEPRITVVFPFWFVQVLVQCFVIIIVLTSIPLVTQKLKANPWFSSFVLMIAFILLRLVYPLFWDTVPLIDQVPTRFIGILWLGWTAYFSKTIGQKLLVTAAAMLFAYIDYGIDQRALWVSLGVPILMFFPIIKLPSIVRMVSIRVAAATFYIFIFNGIVIFLFQKIFHVESIFIGTVVAFVVSIMAWYVLEGAGLMRWVISKIIKKNGRVAAVES